MISKTSQEIAMVKLTTRTLFTQQSQSPVPGSQLICLTFMVAGSGSTSQGLVTGSLSLSLFRFLFDFNNLEKKPKFFEFSIFGFWSFFLSFAVPVFFAGFFPFLFEFELKPTFC